MSATTNSASKTEMATRLSDTVDPKVDALVREKLVTARIGLLLKAPFFGNMATRLELTNADSWLPTAATDGRKFYYNTNFVNSLRPKEIEFLFGHEVLHNVYDHIGRVGDHRDRKLFNVAADFCVNADLIDQRVGEKITTVPCLFDPKYKGWSVEEVYDDLYQNANKINLQNLFDQLLDEHMDGDSGDDDGDGDQDGQGNRSGRGRPRLTEEEKKQIRDEIREAMLQSAQAVGAGNLPAGVKRMIKDLTNPVIDWRELLEQQIQSVIKDDFTWMKPSRRSWHMDAIMPGLKNGTQIDICVAIDTSGSISESMIKEFMSEIKGIMEAYDEYKIQVWSFDTDVYNHQDYTSENLEDIASYQPAGGGGTDFMVNWTYMKENNIEPKKFIMFTDGYPYGSWGDPDYCDTVFIINGNKQDDPPFGIWAHYDEAKNKSK